MGNNNKSENLVLKAFDIDIASMNKASGHVGGSTSQSKSQPVQVFTFSNLGQSELLKPEVMNEFAKMEADEYVKKHPDSVPKNVDRENYIKLNVAAVLNYFEKNKGDYLSRVVECAAKERGVDFEEAHVFYGTSSVRKNEKGELIPGLGKHEEKNITIDLTGKEGISIKHFDREVNHKIFAHAAKDMNLSGKSKNEDFTRDEHNVYKEVLNVLVEEGKTKPLDKKKHNIKIDNEDLSASVKQLFNDLAKSGVSNHADIDKDINEIGIKANLSSNTVNKLINKVNKTLDR